MLQIWFSTEMHYTLLESLKVADSLSVVKRNDLNAPCFLSTFQFISTSLSVTLIKDYSSKKIHIKFKFNYSVFRSQILFLISSFDFFAGNFKPG